LATGLAGGLVYALLQRRVRHALFVLKNLEDATREAKKAAPEPAAAPPKPAPAPNSRARAAALSQQARDRAAAAPPPLPDLGDDLTFPRTNRPTIMGVSNLPNVRGSYEDHLSRFEELRRALREPTGMFAPLDTSVFETFTQDMNAVMGDLARVSTTSFALSDIAPDILCPTCRRLRPDAALNIAGALDFGCTCSPSVGESPSGSTPSVSAPSGVKDEATSLDVKVASAPEGQKEPHEKPFSSAWDRIREG